ncbi:MAG: BrnT family toxin [Thermodesulfobacteriota bacterium]|jgi:uncharacterized DUF497 family protein
MDLEIIDLLLKDQVIDKLIWKHNISEVELRQVFNNQPNIRFIEKGKIKGEHLYVASGRTDAGRYLLIFFIMKKNQKALIVTARDMTDRERKKYAKK